MKRDMDLIRHILLSVERSEKPVDVACFLCEGHATLEDIGYHIGLMEAHGLVDASIYHDMNGDVTGGEVVALTWDGCDYLDAVRDDRVWQRTKRAVKEAVGDTTLSTIKQTASMVSLQLIKMNLGI